MTTVPAARADVPLGGSVPPARRSPAPDLARGTMLLLIALAHAHTYLTGHPLGLSGYASDGGRFDRLVAVVQIPLVDGRALPMFAFLFGYGLTQLVRRQEAAGLGRPQVRRIVRRRSWWLLAFGACHALLLFPGDILGAYGLAGLALTGFLRRSDRAVLRAAGVGLAVYFAATVAFGLLAVALGADDASLGAAGPLEAAGMRLLVWAAATPTQLVVTVIPPCLLGMWAARRRLLEEPGHHRVLLKRTAVLGPATAIVGALPLMLLDAGFWDPSELGSVCAYVLHSITGIAGGLGYAALAGLAAAWISHGFRGRCVRALAACGRWSLTCYLLQSVVFVALFASYAGGLGAHIGDAAASGIAVATWLATVALAALLASSGRRGPAEAALRRLTYGSADGQGKLLRGADG